MGTTGKDRACGWKRYLELALGDEIFHHERGNVQLTLGGLLRVALLVASKTAMVRKKNIATNRNLISRACSVVCVQCCVVYVDLELGQIAEPLHAQVGRVEVIVRDSEVDFGNGLGIVAHVAPVDLGAVRPHTKEKRETKELA